jgi:sulfoxide reductase heme-binding subunit YedZ
MVLLDWARARWLRIATHIGALAPLVWIVWQYTQGAFFIDPVREVISRTGKVALVLLLLSLACTPASTITGWKRPLRVRRAFGLYAFLYASLHFAAFAWWDYGLDLDLILTGIADQKYVLVGLSAGLLLLVLAITSTRGWQRRLGKNWKRLHRLVYLAGLLVIVHFLWLVKDIGEPLVYAGLLAVLLALRIPPLRRQVSRFRQRIQAPKPSVS